jgi:PAS domain S-box-containing protein
MVESKQQRPMKRPLILVALSAVILAALFVADVLALASMYNFVMEQHSSSSAEIIKQVRLMEMGMISGTWLLGALWFLVLFAGLRRILQVERELGHAESDLRQALQRNESILATVPEIIMEVDCNKVYTWANESGFQFFGRDVIGHEAAEYFEGDQFTYKYVEPMFRGAEDVVYVESWQRRADGQVRLLAWWCHVKKDKDGKVIGALSTARDISEEHASREERQATISLLKLLNEVGDKHELFKLITVFMREWSGCEAVGIRLAEGDDYPYFETRGFPDDFVQKESCLCELDNDGNIISNETGDPVLECMCGNIIRGRFDPALPFFTKHGSFWTNSTTDLLAGTSEKDRQARTRNRCHGEGYESVALIPLRHQGRTFGLLQFNDPRRGRFTEARIAYLENIAGNLSVGISQRLVQEELEKSEANHRSLLDSTPDVIMRFDRECRHVFVSHSVEKVVPGMKSADFIGKTHSELGFPAEQCAMWENAIKKVFDTLEPFETEFEIVTGRGRIALNWRLFAELAASGKVKSVLSIARDVTARRAAEVAYKSIFNQMLDGMAVHEMIWDDKGEPVDYRFITINPAFEQMTGFKLADVAGKTVKEVMPVTEDTWIKTYGAVVKTGEPAHFESYSAGLNKHFEVTAYRNAPNQFTVLCMDVSAAKRAEAELAATQFRLEKAQEIGKLGSWDIDVLANKLYWTDENYRLFGVEVGTPLTYEVFESCVHPEDRDAVNRAWQAALKGARYEIEHRVVAGNEIRWLREKAELIVNDQGVVVRAVGFTQDVTDRINAEKELRESELRYRSIFEAAVEGVAVVRIASKRIAYSNKALRDMLGYTQEEMSQLELFDLHPEPEADRARRVFELCVLAGNASSMDIGFRRKDGRVFPCELRVQAIEIDRQPSLVAFVDDLSESKKIEQQRLKLIQADKLASIGTLVAGVAHEINNPNSFIMLNAANLRDIWDDIMPVLEESCAEKGLTRVGLSDLSMIKEMTPKLMADILKGSDRIKSIVSELKLFARQDDARMDKEVNLNDVVESALSIVRNKIKNSASELKVKYDDELPLVRGNHQRLEQVVINLLTNACEAIPERKGAIAVETSTDEERMIAVVRVKDEGAGMTAEVLGRIRDPFFTTKRDSGGTGLGLSVSFGIVEEHGGGLSLDSQPGKGTTAVVVLPAATADAPEQA